MCKDFRLKENPNLNTIVANAAGDSPQTMDSGGQHNTQVEGKHSQGAVGGIEDSRSKLCGDSGDAFMKENGVDKFVTDYTDQVKTCQFFIIIEKEIFVYLVS